MLTACTPRMVSTPGENENIKENQTVMPQEETLMAENKTKPSNVAQEVEINLPQGAETEFSTDFTIHSVSFDEIFSGGPSKDGIPSIDAPKHISIAKADDWLAAREPVIEVLINDEIKAYPIQILTWHEIVNDMVGGVPIAVTYCPLCNTAIVFERTVNDQVLDFGTTGRLRYSNLIMYDRQTETWWQQGTGEGIVGELTGTQLNFVPAAMISWETFKEANPEGKVLSRDNGFNRPYGKNPYPGYDDVNNSPFLYQGPTVPDVLPPLAWVLSIEVNDESVAYAYDFLADLNVINDRVSEQDLVIFWEEGMASPLDEENIADGREMGFGIAYARNLDGQILNFTYDGDNFVDLETGSLWNFHGQAVSGALIGKQLSKVVSVNFLWFAWAAFNPQTRIYQPD